MTPTAPEPQLPEPSATTRAWTWRVLLTALLVYALYAWPLPAVMARRQLYLARSLGEGRLTLGPYAEASGDVAFVDGRACPTVPPATAALGCPLVAGAEACGLVSHAPGRWPWTDELRVLLAFTLLVATLTAALAVASFLRCGLILGRPPPEAARAALLFAFATPLFPYATIAYGTALGALGVVLGVGGLLRAAVTDEPASRRPLVVAGLGLGLAVLADYSASWVALTLALSALLGLGPRRAVWLLAGAAGPALLLGAYHAALTGNPLRPAVSAMTHYGVSETATAQLYGWPSPPLLFELLVGPYQGLLLYWPLLGLGAFGLLRLRRERPELGWLALGLLAAAAAVILVNASMRIGWFAPESFGPRYAFFGTVCLAFGIAPALRHAPPRLCLAAVAVSLFNSWAGAQTAWQVGVFEAPLELIQLGPRLKGVTMAADSELAGLLAALVAVPLLLLALGRLWRRELPPRALQIAAVALVVGHTLLALPYVTLGRGQEEPLRRRAARRGILREALHNDSAPRRLTMSFLLITLGYPADARPLLAEALERDRDDPEVLAAVLWGCLLVDDRPRAREAALLMTQLPPERRERAIVRAAHAWPAGRPEAELQIRAAVAAAQRERSRR